MFLASFNNILRTSNILFNTVVILWSIYPSMLKAGFNKKVMNYLIMQFKNTGRVFLNHL
mgnify:CR=1 FL=1